MWQILRQGWARNGIAVLICLVLGGELFALGYWQRERSVRQQMKAMATKATHSPYPPGNRWPGADGANPNASRFMQAPGANLPPNASPEMKTYLTARDQLMRDHVAYMNQHRTDDPQARQAAMQQWRQQNMTRFQQLQQEAQALAQNNTSATQPTSNTPASITK